jgi:acyl carrier protein
MSIREKFLELVADQMGVKVDSLSDSTSFLDDLGSDSLDSMELMMECEEEFGVDIPDDDVEKFRTVGEVVKYLEAKVGP